MAEALVYAVFTSVSLFFHAQNQQQQQKQAAMPPRHNAFAVIVLLLIGVSPAWPLHAPSPIEHSYKKPAFISFLPETGPDAMLVTSFDILCTDCKLSIVNTSSMESTTLASLNWPNAVTFCPASVCAQPSLLVSRDCHEHFPLPAQLQLHRCAVLLLFYYCRCIAPFTRYLQVGFGFLVPGHTTGGDSMSVRRAAAAVHI